MKNIKPINKKAIRISKPGEPDVHAYSPLPKPDCSSIFGPGIEVHSAASSTDMNASTQGLCSPFYRDTMICGCNWWPAQDPDITVEETNVEWRSEMGHGAGHGQDWQKLRFVYPKSGKGRDAWDKSDQGDLNEIYIKDNWADSGAEPSAGDPWESPDIFVRYNDEPLSNFPNPNVDYHEGNPIAHKKNYLYARVRNIGKHTIDHVYVKFYVYGLSTNPGGELVGHAMLRDLPPGTVKVVKSIKPWVPQKTGGACTRVILDSTQDPVKILGSPPSFVGYDEKMGPQIWNVSVQGDNNVAQRNLVSILALQGGAPIRIHFNIRPRIPPRPEPDWYRIEVERQTLPREANISLNLPRDLIEGLTPPLWFRAQDLGERVFQSFLPILKVFMPRMAKLQNRVLKRLPLKQDQSVDANLTISMPASIGVGREHRIVIRQHLNKQLLGGITVSAKVVAPETERFIGNVETEVAHIWTCPQVRDLDISKKRAFHSFNDARSWGYKVHEECSAGYD